ncbi:hybrid sensor histidine kinase/response regulator [Tautonia sociabilis]|uniref:histidine kinase n=2 Tax=Tautonia sociabilis TaxID=2080755 RepID=A0A432MJI1_9BACT|nr:hybrid sensor histidine kinase/response regulator [Tautonia sociabilis]
MELYRQEAEGYVGVLSEGLLALERGASSGTVEPLMRAAHSIKGAARIVGLGAAERVAHALEDALVAAGRGEVTLGKRAVDTMLAGVDLLSESAQIAEADVEEWNRGSSDRVEALVGAIRAILDGPPTGSETGTDSEPESADPSSAEPGTVSPELGEGAGASPSEPAAEPESPPPAPVKPTEEPAREAAPAPSASAGGVVRVAAESLSRLLGLAGESLVEVRQLRPLVDALLEVRAQQVRLGEEIRAIERREAETADGRTAESAEALTRREAIAHARDGADRCLAGLDRAVEALEAFARRNEELAERLHFEVIGSRMRPLSEGVRGFPRLVRDVAHQLGKRVRFEVVGERTGVDRDILDRLEAPLNHLIRNALDHAIEPPEERLAAGKPAEGTIRLEARHHAGMLQLTVSDDGRGIDPERLRAKVVERGLAAPAMAERLSDGELFEFLFLPGFSTKGEVTELSGRGVGLDVVQSTVQSVGGQMQTTSTLGAGTQFHIRLPITLSVVRALLVRIDGEPYAFPLSRLDRVAVVGPESFEELEGRPFLRLDDDQPIGVLPAAEALGLGNAGGGPLCRDRLPVLVIADRGQRFGLIVDELMGERDLDVRPLDPRLGKVPDLSGASVLDDSWPVLIVDVEDLVRSVDARLHGFRFRLGASGKTAGEAPAAKAKRVLVVDDSITVRELERQLLANRGYDVDTAVDGLDGWNALRQGRYDLVVTDVDMPRLDGIGLVRRIREDDRLRGLPVVIVSYKDRPEDRMRGLEAGADGYLTKSSFHDDLFISTVVDLIGEAGRP